MQLHYLMSKTHTFPVSKFEVMRNTSHMIVKRTMRTIGQGRQFGFEEMMMRQKERLFRAEAIGNERVEILYLSKKHFLKQLSGADINQYLEICAPYTDI